MKLVIIGAGPGGYTAAFEAAAKGWDVSLIENQSIGGTCLNCGCIPTKSLRASADALETAKRMQEFAVSACPDPVIEPLALQDRKNKIIDVLRGGLKNTCAKLKINFIQGTAEIADAKHVTVQAEAGPRTLEADNILVATGSSILELPGLPFDHQHILNSNDALDLTEIPKSVIIVGGGVIGCELACIYSAFGSQITIVEGQDRLLPMPSVDQETSGFLAKEMRKRKIKTHFGATISDVRINDGLCRATLAPSPFVSNPKLPPNPVLEAEKIFVTVGRKPNTAGLGLQNCGIETDQRGWIKVNEHFQTSLPGVYAVGDVLGPAHAMLAHVAAMESLCALKNIAGKASAFDYSLVPSTIFTEPEIGCIGMSEAQAKAAFPKVVCALKQMRELGKAQAMSELPGFCKIIANAENGQIAGVFIAGARASDLIAEAVLAMSQKLTVYDLANLIHSHPTLSEILWETARHAVELIEKSKES